MEKLKIGVIGVGRMGRNHVRILTEEDGCFDFIGIYDKNEDQARQVAERYSVNIYSEMDQLLDCVDAVIVAVPSSLHKEIGLKAAMHNVHTLIEKPIATTTEDAKLLVKAFEERHLKLSVGHVERFNPVYTELGKIVENNRIFYVEAHRYSPFSGSGRITDVSVVEDLMIHDVDLVLSIMAPYGTTDIRANGENICSNKTDFATAMIEFEDNAHAIINASRVSQNKERIINFHMEDCTVCADLLARTLVVTQSRDIKDVEKAVSELRRVCRKKLIVVLPRQRNYRYTMDLHIHFYPYRYNVQQLMCNKEATIELLDHDWFYMEYKI